MKKAMVFEASRDGYAIDQIRPVTIGELREFLENYPDDMLFVLSHDNGYTYGSVNIWGATEWRQNNDDEDFEKVW